MADHLTPKFGAISIVDHSLPSGIGPRRGRDGVFRNLHADIGIFQLLAYFRGFVHQIVV